MREFRPMQRNRETVMALTVFLALVALSLLQPFSAITLWLFPFPVIAISVLQPRMYASTMAVIAGFVLVLAGFGWLALFFIIALYFLAWSIRENILNNKSPYLSVITITLVFVMLELVLLALIHWSGIDIISVMKSQLKQSIAQDEALMKSLGYNSDNAISQTLTWIQTMFPAMLSLVALAGAMANVWLLRWNLKARYDIPPLLRNWKLPYSVLLVYILSLSLILLQAFKSTPLLWQLMQNIELIGAFLIGIQGISFIWRIVGRFRFRAVILIIAIAASFLSIISMLYVVLGVVDIVNETRLRRKQ